jgi:hypothetical protein
LSSEGRKFGLHAALAAQSLSALGERLGSAVRTNVASVALLEPGPEDVRDLGRLFAPVSPEELLAMRRFDVVVRTRGSDGTPLVRGGRVSMPGPAQQVPRKRRETGAGLYPRRPSGSMQGDDAG